MNLDNNELAACPSKAILMRLLNQRQPLRMLPDEVWCRADQRARLRGAAGPEESCAGVPGEGGAQGPLLLDWEG